MAIRPIFFDDETFVRLLSFDEVMDATAELGFNFNQARLLPIFDVGDNDFVCYDINEQKWVNFNIVDECKFKASDFIL